MSRARRSLRSVIFFEVTLRPRFTLERETEEEECERAGGKDGQERDEDGPEDGNESRDREHEHPNDAVAPEHMLPPAEAAGEHVPERHAGIEEGEGRKKEIREEGEQG